MRGVALLALRLFPILVEDRGAFGFLGIASPALLQFVTTLQTKIPRNLEISRSAAGRLHMHRAASLLENAQATLRQAHPELTRITPAGDFRRGCELVGDFAVVAQAPALEGGQTVLPGGGTLAVHLSDAAHYGAAPLLATGSQAHLEALQSLALQKGLHLDPKGFRRGRKTVAARTEQEIYAALGLPFIPPELREGRDEIDRAIAGTLPRLVEDTCAASCMRIPIYRTASIRWK